MTSQYLCETCKHIDKVSYRHYYCTYGKEELDGSDLAFITRIGCASHSDFQSEREKVLDELKGIVDDAISKLYTGTEDVVSSHARHKAFAWVNMKIAELREGKDGE